MAFNEKQEVCPVCGDSARVTRKWVLNRYGKRYDYFIYHHQRFIHYYGTDEKNSRYLKKGDLEKVLIETINSQEFRLGSFKVSDIKKLLTKDFSDVGFGSIKTSLERLVEVGMIERRKEGRNLYYINTVSKDRLSFVISSLSVGLEDVDRDYMFKRHVFVYKVKNDHPWPLYYIPFRYVGDVGVSFEDLELHAIDPSNSKDFRVMLIEDTPTDKRVLLKLPSPLLPEQQKEIRIEYNWSEPRQFFVFSAATNMDSFQFSVSGNNSTKLIASVTLASKNETRDLSGSIKVVSSDLWKSISSINLREVESFSVLQFKWKPI